MGSVGVLVAARSSAMNDLGFIANAMVLAAEVCIFVAGIFVMWGLLKLIGWAIDHNWIKL